MNPPVKPFPGYKWRWATLTCTEGLNNPPVYFGVLRALRTLEGLRPSDDRLVEMLRMIRRETDTRVTLARDARRNIIRNSGQYWKALGLLEDTRPAIALTELGRRVADGQVAPIEFAMTVVRSLELPNPRIERNVVQWGDLRIKPLQLILNILAQLDESYAGTEAYLTPFELTRIVIPLAGERAPAFRHLAALKLHRDGDLDLTDWPDCTPGANDRRMAREFLLFLFHYGFCRSVQDHGAAQERYFLSALEPGEVIELNDVDVEGLTYTEALERVRDTQLPAAAERKRVLTSILSRPRQARFRELVLDAFQSTCLFTGAGFPPVLEAAHIVPVLSSGSDTVENGLCLRADVHRLFDSGHLRLEPSGQVHLSETAARSGDYVGLASRVAIPAFVSIEKVKWRWSYGSLGD